MIGRCGQLPVSRQAEVTQWMPTNFSSCQWVLTKFRVPKSKSTNSRIRCVIPTVASGRATTCCAVVCLTVCAPSLFSLAYVGGTESCSEERFWGGSLLPPSLCFPSSCPSQLPQHQHSQLSLTEQLARRKPWANWATRKSLSFQRQSVFARKPTIAMKSRMNRARTDL